MKIIKIFLLVFLLLTFNVVSGYSGEVELPSLDAGVDPNDLKRYDPDYIKNQGEPIQNENKNIVEKEKNLERLKGSPKYTVPNRDRKGNFGRAK